MLQKSGRRRFIFEADGKQNLSDVLRELRLKEEEEEHSALSQDPARVEGGFPDVASSFERSSGMIHLEALEMVAASRPRVSSGRQRFLHPSKKAMSSREICL